MSRIMDSAVMDLPEPDSPTSASTDPLESEKLTPRTASTAPCGDGKVVLRFLTDKRAVN